MKHKSQLEDEEIHNIFGGKTILGAIRRDTL